MTRIQSTPAFLVWSVDQRCSARLLCRDQSPFEVERTIRPLRAIADAQVEGRIFDGICISRSTPPLEPMGFSIDETLQLIGGYESAAEACRSCYANVGRGTPSNATNPATQLGGCFGVVLFNDDRIRLDHEYELMLASDVWSQIHESSFDRWRPRWIGLWNSGGDSETPNEAMAKSRHRTKELLVRGLFRYLRRRFASVSDKQIALSSSNSILTCDEDLSVLIGLTRLIKALKVTRNQPSALRTSIIPAGKIENGSWLWEAHCGRCFTSMTSSQRRCLMCGRQSGPIPIQKRKPRGLRPYMPLTRFLSQERIHELTKVMAERGRH